MSDIDAVMRFFKKNFKPHPWHGSSLATGDPKYVHAYIEIVPTDTVKYELDKESGYLKIDRPQKYSNIVPTLYGFLPQTYSGDKVAKWAKDATKIKSLKGDADPIDICVLTERTITHGDLILSAKPIGGFRMLDNGEVDDKILAVLKDDPVYGGYEDIQDCPEGVIKRLKHYFLTYKEMPGEGERKRCEIRDIYGRDEAMTIIGLGIEDYKNLSLK